MDIFPWDWLNEFSTKSYNKMIEDFLEKWSKIPLDKEAKTFGAYEL